MPIEASSLIYLNGTVMESLLGCVGPKAYALNSLFRCLGPIAATDTASSNMSGGFAIPPASAFMDSIACVCVKTASDDIHKIIGTCAASSPYPEASTNGKILDNLYDSFCVNAQTSVCKAEIEKSLGYIQPEAVKRTNATSAVEFVAGIVSGTGAVDKLGVSLCLEGHALLQNCVAPELSPLLTCSGETKVTATVAKTATAGAVATNTKSSSRNLLCSFINIALAVTFF
ncbi:hypothetical protein HDU99_009724 [Rhizoclosmatium hyalinum]|nr:hypothetical protein HDU99_009724 [Rhizoclosmatium hyalinum]